MKNNLPAKLDAGLPATIEEPDQYVALEDAAERADYFVSLYDDMKTAIKESRYVTAKALANAELELSCNGDPETTDDLAELVRELEKFDPRDAYDSKGRITRAQASKHMAMLIGSFGGARPTAIQIARLLNEVMAAKLMSVPALEMACRQIIRTTTTDFMPATGKVVAAIKEQNEIWGDRRRAIEGFPGAVQKLRAIVAEMTKVLAAEQVKQEEQNRRIQEQNRIDDEVRDKPLGVGDRVICWGQRYRENGTIIEVDNHWSRKNPGFVVIMDDTAEVYFYETTKLTRVLPSNWYFVIRDESKRAAVEQKMADRADMERQRLWPPLNIGDPVFDTSSQFYGTIVGMSDDPIRYREVKLCNDEDGTVEKVSREYLQLA